MEAVDTLAQRVWEYMQLHQTIQKADIILACGSLDTRVAERAAQLYSDGLGKLIVFSGNVGSLTKDVFSKPEAETFAEIGQQHGVPADNILTENKSTNTGENIRFTYDLLQERAIRVESMILVQTPYTERRNYATFKKQWPDPNTKIWVTSPAIAYADYPNAENSKDLVINIMVGDLQRTKEYPKLGYQIYQAIPEEVWSAAEKLIALGYDGHLIGRASQ